MATTPDQIVSRSKLTSFQIVAIAITVGLNGLDGFDVLSISFAAPGIAAEWGINRAALGFVLAVELMGMAAGSIMLGGVTDKIGRRPMILGCLVVMSVGMLLATMATGVTTLSIWRLLTGLGIGGMLAATNAAVAEHSNDKNRNLAVSLMAIGYPIGAVLGGSVAAWLLQFYSWRAVFLLGGCVSLLFIPIVWFRLPETVAFLCQRQPKGALERVNKTLKRMGHATADALPPPRKEELKGATSDLFSPALIATTVIVTLAYFTHIATFYFILKWVPKIVVDMGFAASSAAGVLVWANVGGAIGGALLGLLTRRFPVRILTIGVLLVSFVMVSVFGSGHTTLTGLALVAASAGFFTNAGVVGLYAIFAEAFPTHVRASGTGFAIGIGRGGASLSPIVAGFLFEGGFGLQGVAILMASGSLLAAAALFFLKTQREPTTT
ncbi:MFS transporter [Salinisphaera orenii MK-B5]|uniref:MFS transporter n=1 Tax=Salinisphaera orenii MK-B5 TaxID=856730 RepID=A0A423PPU0_9GAMM|nr:MFS transporter [Salinisphaera orenii]ROO27610.1 MFS transporter [Salinisphaera orenii MK-B5]